MISKRLFELIRRQVPKITKVSQPIFAADFEVKIGEKGEIIKKYKYIDLGEGGKRNSASRHY